MSQEDFEEGRRYEQDRQRERRAGVFTFAGLGLICLAVALVFQAWTHRYKYHQECQLEGGMVIEDTWTGKIDRRFE